MAYLNREWLTSYPAWFIRIFALAALTACIGDGGDEGTPDDQEISNPGAGSGAGEPQGETPVLAQLDDILGGGSCCAVGDSNCICRDAPPLSVSSWPGPYRVADFGTGSGTVYYPSNADPPFAGVALCGGFLNFGPEMSGWGTYFASWGIVTLITSTSPIDIPDIRAILLAGAVEELKRQNGDAGSPIYQKMSGRYGTAGYSMGGGGTSIAAAGDPSLKSSMGLAAWFPVGRGVSVPTLFMCGGIDAVAGCNLSDDAFNSMPNTTPKMTVMVEGVGHLSWFGPNSTSGPYGLAFQKTYLEGDSRWKARLTGLGIPRASNIR